MIPPLMTIGLLSKSVVPATSSWNSKFPRGRGKQRNSAGTPTPNMAPLSVLLVPPELARRHCHPPST